MDYTQILSSCSSNDIILIVLCCSGIILGSSLYFIPYFYKRLLLAIFFKQEEITFPELKKQPFLQIIHYINAGQLFLLLSISFYLINKQKLFLDYSTGLLPFIKTITFLLLATFLFFSSHKIIYILLGKIFCSKESRKSFSFSYKLYYSIPIPLLYITILFLLQEKLYSIGFFLFCITFIIWRFLIILKVFQTLKEYDISFLQFSLYLCSHEIIPFAIIFKIAFARIA